MSIPSLYLNSKLFHRPSRDDRDTSNIGEGQDKKIKLKAIPQEGLEPLEPEDDDRLNEASKAEAIPGGLASGKKPSDFDPKQLKAGVKVEEEHFTPNKKPKATREIAMDHLSEDPEYYKKLAKMEGEEGTKKAIDILKSVSSEPDTTGELEGKFKVSLQEMIRLLNEVVEAEYSQWLRWYHYAIVLRGHARESLAGEFETHAEEELKHAEAIASRVIVLGGYPSTKIEQPKPLQHMEEIIKELLVREQEGMRLYRKVIDACGDNIGTRVTIEANVEQEQEHIDDLWRYLKHPEQIRKAGADQESAGRDSLTEGEAKRAYKHSFERVAPGISGGQTPDLPERGRDWHGTVPGVPDEDDEGEGSDLDRPPAKLLGDEAKKALAGAPRFSSGPLVPPMEAQWLQMQGYSPEDIQSGRVKVTSRQRAAFNKFMTATVQKSINGLGGFLP